MHLGLTPWNFKELSAKSLTEQACFAEALGYQSFWLPEFHFQQPALPDPLMSLASIAAGAEKIKLGVTSYLLTIRHPLLAAEQVATLDQLSNGRVILGVGRGYASEMFKAFDVDPKAKRTLFETRLEFMRRAWSGMPIALDKNGDGSITLDPLPVQQPYPPIWVAAFGPKALAQAGRLGMPYLASPVETLSALQTNLIIHSEAATEAGHDLIQARPIMRTIYISDRVAEIKHIREQLAQRNKSAFRDENANVEDWAIVGEHDYVVDKLARYKEVLNISHLIVSRLNLGGIEQTKPRDSLAKIADCAVEL